MAIMSATARAWSAVKPHIPLIKFRKGGGTETQGSSHSMKPKHSEISLKGSGIEESDMPVRYLRKPLSQLEMEIIERGGPE